jgi:phage/plasmid primase-like uncharacterized protein
MAKLERAYLAHVPDDRPAEQQLIDAIAYEGLTPPATVQLDGRLHRFKSGPGADKTGWYVAFADARPAGVFGCWRTGVEQSWRAETGHQMTPAEEVAHAKRLAEMRAERDAEQARLYEVTAKLCADIWSDLAEAPADHPYLARKGIVPHGARVTGDGRLVVPLYGADGTLSSLQYVTGDGVKRYQYGGATGGKFWILGPVTDGVMYLAEGFATAATIHEVTGRPCAVAYSASNLVPVAGTLLEMFGPDLCIVADNDKGHAGQRAADQAQAKHGVRYVMPPDLGDANDYVQAGKDLAALLSPTTQTWLISADEFCAQPAPLSWLIKGWAQANALIMLHGPSGSGKTFVVLDWCCSIASGASEWRGAKVKPGPVVVLAGEGHHGLRGRVAAWKVRHADAKLQMWISQTGCDLDKSIGLHQAVAAISCLPTPPSLIVVDTLHRFLSGDENSAQDAKAMLDSCAALMEAFKCSVLLVHHTGNNDEAQGRARGSSAWRGALDIEISVTTKDDVITIAQKKSKDAELLEPVYATLESVTLPGWLDEDNEPVTSAVLATADAPPKREKESPGAKHRKTVEAAWWASGAETLDGAPYLTRSALAHYLETNSGWAPATLRQHLKPSAEPGRLLRDLLDCGFLKIGGAGWVVCDSAHASRLLLAKTADVGGGTT